MGTFTLSKSNLSSILSSLSVEDKTWAIKYLVDDLALQPQEQKQKGILNEAVWKDYVVSPEVKSITIKHRKDVSENYKEEIANILKKKYQ